jgi:hypothetical protein
MNLTLRWQGPIGPGLFPEAGDDLAVLAVPGVYLRVKRYEQDRTVSYVGQSRQLIVRFDQHLRDILTFSAALRDETGAVVLGREGASRYGVYNALDNVMPMVAAEAARLRFFWAACEDGFDEEYLSLVEGALKTRLEEQAMGDETALAVENRQGIAEPDFEDDIVIVHELDELAVEDRAVVNTILGAAPIRLAVRIAELGHAE